jgi:hypothetical protein
METKTMLDNISTAIESVVKGLQPAPTTKRMALDSFVGYALDELKRSATEEPRDAGRRLSALKRSVDGALASIAKLNPEDTDSDKIEIEVLTAWAPSKTEGDEPEELTTSDEQSSKEISPVAIEHAPATSAFATNLDDVAKALRRMRDELGGKKEEDKERSATKKSADDAWPLDLNSAAFRKGVQKSAAAPEWGFDPEGVSTPKG